MKKSIFTLLLVAFITGCAQHATIEMPYVEATHNEAWKDKKFDYDILYSQPKPGVFSGGEQLPLKPIEEAELSVASSATLKNFSNYLIKQLPEGIKLGSNTDYDYKLIVEMEAKDKKGPAYADYNAGESFAKGMLTLGFAASEYEIIADFTVTYKLLKSDGDKIIEYSYKVSDSVPHERGDFESFNSLNDYSGQLLEKHMIITLNDFIKKAASMKES
ncbi:hypothetical protein [Endozoicomonas sp. ONNA1]|uniref:hypothetical protein n=1 Tax=Endozoicomonas sp. ONNA1 TaxID=2828740 RepID=UPI002149655F|nr:hypothetical protein [Endozoicomonas sp. ONNA1]